MSRVRVHNFSISLDGFGTGDGLSLEMDGGTTFHFLDAAVVDALDEQYHVEAVSTPSGVTHLTFTR